MPSMATLLTATSNTSNLIFDSPFLFHRQHHVMGYSEMVLLIGYELKLPDVNSSNFNNAFIYYSQVSCFTEKSEISIVGLFLDYTSNGSKSGSRILQAMA